MSYGLTLALDGSTYAGSAAVIRDMTVLASRELSDAAMPGKDGREENFLPMVAACLADADVGVLEVDRVVCGSGPGSFTSLRIAASIAKGIAVGAGRPLFAVPSLMLIVADVKPGRYLATLGAMRGEVFAGQFEVTAEGRVEELSAVAILGESAVAAEAERLGAKALAGVMPHARAVSRMLPTVLATGEVDIATWEPTYGRLAEAQVRWEALHGRPLTAAG